jgi:hypothetical protein
MLVAGPPSKCRTCVFVAHLAGSYSGDGRRAPPGARVPPGVDYSAAGTTRDETCFHLLLAIALGRLLESKRRILIRVLFIARVVGMSSLSWSCSFTFDKRTFARRDLLGGRYVVWCFRS